MTPSTATGALLTAAQLLRLVDWRTLADLATDTDGPRPTRRSLSDETTAAGATVAEHRLAALGELESACLAGGRYTADDLAALSATTAGGMYLRRLLAALTHWSLAQRRDPAAADPERVAGAKVALAVLEQLRLGERILPFAETAAAGGGPTTTPNYDSLTEPGGSETVARAGRLFDTREGC